MMWQTQIPLRLTLVFALLIVDLALAEGCHGTIGNDPGDPGAKPETTTTTATGTGSGGGPGTGTAGSGAGPGTGGGAGTGTDGGPGTGTGGAGGGAAGAGGGPVTTPCTGTELAAPKRLIRLTFNQLVNSVRTLFDDRLAASIATTNNIPDATQRTFPPLANPREGAVITDSQWQTGDAIAQQVSKYVLDNVATVTGCGANLTDACAQQYLATFAERAYRRPLTAGEKASFDQVYMEVKAAGGTINEGVQYGVYAALESPKFLYRTEFGSAAVQEGPLSVYEMASQLSFFIADAPPDPPLLEAAQKGDLATAANIEAHASRLLATEAAKQNLQQAVFAYFGTGGITSVILPSVTDGVKNSMYRESELFIQNTLWDGKLTNLITSRRTFINKTLADAVYGVPWPPAGVTLDADGFGAFQLPDSRSGLVTLPAYMSSRSRPDVPSVVGRGLLINDTMLCGEKFSFPEDLKDTINQVNTSLAGKSEREKADYRAMHPVCGACHRSFDAYGLVLENYDLIGKYRTVDDQGRPIDASATLPANAGGATVPDAVAMALTIANNGAFATCVAKNLILFGLAEPVALGTNSCATRAVANAFSASDGSFSALVRAVAVSRSLGFRSPGGT
jgi:Protein of unknown function (DUF1592)/Protein of unknown function (DUF1595)/Protein of unknown function (DUF1588)